MLLVQTYAGVWMEHKYALGKVQVTGVSKIVREAEESGMVVLERNGQRVALVVPLSPSGFGRFIEQLLAITSGGKEIDRDFQMYMRFLIDSVRDDLGRLIVPSDGEQSAGNAAENTSALSETR